MPRSRRRTLAGCGLVAGAFRAGLHYDVWLVRSARRTVLVDTGHRRG